MILAACQPSTKAHGVASFESAGPSLQIHGSCGSRTVAANTRACLKTMPRGSRPRRALTVDAALRVAAEQRAAAEDSAIARLIAGYFRRK
jgi:hypothetical protein